MWNKISQLLSPQKPTMLRVRRADENHGALYLGDTGTGKTQMLHQNIAQARGEDRREPGICYDPAGEFCQVHLQKNIDFILNPLDERFPNWQIHWEVENGTDADLVAESFFPTQYADNNQKFFNDAAKGIFKLMLKDGLPNRRMIEILASESLIDKLVKGTELAHKISPKAGPQRAAVLGTLADAAAALRLLPEHDKNRKDFSLSHWAKTKKSGWLFLTTTLDTRQALRPLQAAMLNILMMRLMSIPPESKQRKHFWFIADELHSLHSLSALPTFIYESRKFGAKYLFGTQNKQQIVKYYGQEAPAMLAAAALKIFLRCNEPETAQWVSDNIGAQDREMPYTSTSVDAGSSGRVSTSFSNRTERKIIVSREQIMQLKKLHGFWSYDGKVVPFRLSPKEWKKKHPAFISCNKRLSEAPTRAIEVLPPVETADPIPPLSSPIAAVPPSPEPATESNDRRPSDETKIANTDNEFDLKIDLDF